MRILHLYPNLMNLYGEYGNIRVLVSHLNDLGIDVSVDNKELGDDIDIDSYDFIYMGSGTEDKQLVALNDLRRFEKELKEYIEDNKVLLFTGNAMELLGKKIDDNDALNLLDFSVETTEKRYVGDVIVHNDEIGDVVGFINKSTLIKDGEDYKLFDYIFKDNNLIDNDYEGYRYKNSFGTHIIGPILVKNPCLMSVILKLLTGERYQQIKYENEEKSYNVTLEELRRR